MNEIENGIAAYKRDQQVILRLLRKKGGAFTERDFDRWFRGREYRRRVRLRAGGITGDSFILGMGANGGTLWAFYLELMQMMMRAGKLDAKKINGVVTYINVQ